VKRLTLDETWEECLRMWKWIASSPRLPKHKCPSHYLIVELKRTWLKKEGYDPQGMADKCFFCEYAVQKYIDSNGKLPKSLSLRCSYCPGRKVSRKFDCMCDDYNYARFPKRFYAELCRLNKIRMDKKRKGRTKNEVLAN